LGLSIAYDIVKKHNGELSVQSEPGMGTIFRVMIPVVNG
jgi:two-component system NtrC family sensor kinase